MPEAERDRVGGDGSATGGFCYFPLSCTIKPKKLLSGFGRSFGNFFKGNLPRRCDRFRYDACMRRFAALAAERNGRQIGTIGFHHEFPERDSRRDFPHRSAIFKSHNSRERNEMIKIENFVCLIHRATETMKNPAQFAGIWLHDFQRVFPGVPLVNHYIETQLYREVELLLKKARLF